MSMYLVASGENPWQGSDKRPVQDINLRQVSHTPISERHIAWTMTWRPGQLEMDGS